MSEAEAKLHSEGSGSIYKQMYKQSDEENRGKAISTREAILKSDAKVNSKHKADQSNKFERKSKLQVDIYTNQNASLSSNFNKVATYYDEVRDTVSEYGDSIKLFEEELDELRKFSETKNEEISDMMPAEFEKFTLQIRNFFAKQQTQNFKMKKYAVKLTKDISELREKLMSAMDRVSELEKSVSGDTQMYGMNNEEIERRSHAGSVYSPGGKDSVY